MKGRPALRMVKSSMRLPSTPLISCCAYSIGTTGLGLAIAQTMVESHVRNIAAASGGLGQSATVTIRLPSNELAPYTQAGNSAEETAI